MSSSARKPKGGRWKKSARGRLPLLVSFLVIAAKPVFIPLDGRPGNRCLSRLAHKETAARATLSLERVHSLRSRTPKKAKATICRLVLNLRSQFFQSRLFFSNQEKLRSTTHRFGNTAKRCNSFRLAISTSAPINAYTDEANALPV